MRPVDLPPAIKRAREAALAAIESLVDLEVEWALSMQRSKEMCRRRAAGWTYKELGAAYGISKQRAEQVVHGHRGHGKGGEEKEATTMKKCPKCGPRA